MRRSFAICSMLCLAAIARADELRSIEVTFRPSPDLQIAVWIEDPQGNFIDTAYVTRLTGALGLGNRPGLARFRTDFRFPYGRRDMVLPVWAHTRNHQYRLVVMGGHTCGGGLGSTGGVASHDCDEDTTGYHTNVSSDEPFYCSPRGGVTTQVGGVDVVSCASRFTGCKGAYAPAPAFSLYPPRADLTRFDGAHDSDDAPGFAADDDLVAISGATPAGSMVTDPPIRWTPPTDGPYVLKIEASAESDFNLYHHHPNVDDAHVELNAYGHDFLGQPSIVYAVPFTAGPVADAQRTSSYAGYGDWDGASGTLHAPDPTISTDEGSGAGRLLLAADELGAYRVRVRALPTGGVSTCPPPGPPEGLAVVAHPTSLELSFASAPGGPATRRFDVRYREGQPISDGDFLSALPASALPPAPGAPGSTVKSLLGGLRAEVAYTVAVRALSACGAPSKIVSASVTTTRAQFATLSGCFFATAAYGTPLAPELDVLRRFRDRRLIGNPLGALAVAAYYAFSPPLARAVASDEWLRAVARKLIGPLVEALRAQRF